MPIRRRRLSCCRISCRLTLVLAALKPLLEDPARKVIGQNIKYDYQVLRRYGIDHCRDLVRHDAGRLPE